MEITSFRDPAGNIQIIDDKVFRHLNSLGQLMLSSFLQSSIAEKMIAEGLLVKTHYIDDKTLEHEKIFFPSYPYEWSFGMLQDAGMLTIDIAIRLFEEGFGLKDASPYNILFKGAKPVFIDLLSFEKRDEQEYTWIPYGQYVRNFILPLLIANRISMKEIFLCRNDGLELEEVYCLCGRVERLFPPFLTNVSIPTWLSKLMKSNKDNYYLQKRSDNPEKAKFIYITLLNRVKKHLLRLQTSKHQKSTWSEYTKGNNNYTDEQMTRKFEFIKQIVLREQPKHVLDIGCNTGDFSILAAEQGAEVVAIDYDAVVIDRLYQRAKNAKLNILPLVMNLSRPTPSMGWKNQEYFSFAERAKGKFDMVFMLALIHHLLITDRIPLCEILEQAAELTNRFVIIEYIDTEDSMFKSLLKGRNSLYEYLNIEYFEREVERFFVILQKYHIGNSQRTLYLLEKNNSILDIN